MLTIGMDAHQRLYVLCILDENGKLLERRTIRGRWAQLIAFLKDLGRPFQICYEASCSYGHLYDRLRPLAKRIVVAHPGAVRLIFRSKRKSDRVDAEKLAKLLYLGEVPPVYVPSVDTRAWRQLIEFRHREVAKRTRVKNSLRSLLRTHGIDSPPYRNLWTKKGLAWLADVELGSWQGKLQRDLQMSDLATCEQRIGRIEKCLAEIARKHPAIALLLSIPGVGIRTAEAVVAYIDDPRRFRRSRQVGSYVGLVPCQDQSAGVNRLGHITRQGPATVRKMLVEAAWQAIRRSERIKRRYEAYMRGDVKRKKIALVATAHYLVRIMHTMLLNGEMWREEAA